MWWMMQSKKKEILTLIENLESLQGEIAPVDRQRLSKIAKIASYFVVLLSCFYPSLWVIGHILFNQSRCPFDSQNLDMKSTIIPKIAYEYGSAYVNHYVYFTFTTFYLLICLIVANSLNDKKRHRIQAFRLYKNVLKMFEDIEDTLSPFMLFLFARMLAVFFLFIYQMLYAVRLRNWPLINMSIPYFFINAVLMIIIVLSTDRVQKKTDKFRLSLYQYIELNSILNGEHLRILEDWRHLKLTAWGVFAIKKSVILATGAWLFTYSIAFLQFPS
ncbi:uncharacterized protein CDAR_266011 [Caerostris darwini]|uniref:Gustatory receptor n=1 Tax=Caerostris darwini TaxID=1538125 RepID=A0AAV4QRJ9_9ARAC|nr:uncharacterized protein CDAR_266011 [Caerostris darwini]